MSATLAIDTATPYLTLALLWQNGEIETSHEVGRLHAEFLPSCMQNLFIQAGLDFYANSVEKIVLGIGPGSYTGVRVGASYALGLAQVWQASVLGVSTLEGLVIGSGVQAVSQDARKGNVYSAIYEAKDGVVLGSLAAVEKRELGVFSEQAAGLPHHKDAAPSGLALLKAGLNHGTSHYSLFYL